MMIDFEKYKYSITVASVVLLLIISYVVYYNNKVFIDDLIGYDSSVPEQQVVVVLDTPKEDIIKEDIIKEDDSTLIFSSTTGVDSSKIVTRNSGVGVGVAVAVKEHCPCVKNEFEEVDMTGRRFDSLKY